MVYTYHLVHDQSNQHLHHDHVVLHSTLYSDHVNLEFLLPVTQIIELYIRHFYSE